MTTVMQKAKTADLTHFAHHETHRRLDSACISLIDLHLRHPSSTT